MTFDPEVVAAKAMATELPSVRRRREWTRSDEFWRRSAAEAEAAEARLTPEDADLEARGQWEDAGAERDGLWDEPGDPLLDREPMNGDSWWKDGV